MWSTMANEWFLPGAAPGPFASGHHAGDMPKPGTDRESARKARLAAELRANLAKRKAQARAKRDGEADQRPEGIAAAEAKGNAGRKG